VYSCLVVFIGTTAYSIFNQPNIALVARWYYVHNDIGKNYPRIDYYEINVHNVGVAQAINVTLSMFFVGNITYARPVLYDENLTMRKESPHLQSSVAIAHIPKLARGY
jgi:hypothetical protein